MAQFGRQWHTWTAARVALTRLLLHAACRTLCLAAVCRYCQYQIGRKGGAAPDASELLGSIGGGGSDQLQSKLASLAAEAQAQRASATSSLSWAGETFPVREEKICIPLHTAQASPSSRCWAAAAV